MRGALRGLGAGVVAGGTWWVAEGLANRAAGGIVPDAIARTLASIDVGTGAIAGMAAGVLAPALGGAALAGVLAVAHGLLRVAAPPGIGAEAAFLVAGAIAVAGIVALSGADRRSWLAFGHVTLLAVGAAGLGGLVLAETHAMGLHGLRLPILVALLPVAAVAVDRGLGVAVPRRGLRLSMEGAALAVGLAIWAHPLDPAPRRDAIVTAVPPPAGSPDVILVSLDTTRADHLSTYGYERDTSPNLTAVADDALVFTEARTAAGWTLPGHASMFTGLFPSRHGAHLAGGWLPGQSIDGRRNVAHPLAAERVTLAEVLRDRGYQTGAFVANFSYLYRDFGLGQGFGIYDDAPGVLFRIEPYALRAARAVVPGFAAKPFRTARDVNAAALAWLDGLPVGRPAFVFVNYMEPHQPWVADPPHDRWVRAIPGAARLAQRNLYTHALRDFTPEELAFIVANYDGQVQAMDAAFGELRAALVARGRWEGALVIVTADHGELLGEHGQVGHMGRMLYEPLVRVPMILKLPGAERPRGRIGTPVQVVDVLPTVAAVTGAVAPSDIDGEHLQAVTRPSFAEEDINPFLVAEYGATYDRAVRVAYDAGWKLVTTSRGERKLYDLQTDPGETRDRAATEPTRVDQLARRLEARLTFSVAAGAARGQVN